MKRINETIRRVIKAISRAVYRFPLTAVSLIGAASLICYMISLHKSPPLITEKLLFTLLVSAVLGMAAQFALERFERLSKMRLAVYGLSVLLAAGYFLILRPAPEVSVEIGVRTFAAVFAAVCFVLWFPSFRDRTDFNKIALVHFKSVFTAALYAAVLSAGIAAIIAAVDILLLNVDNDAYAYMMAVVWVLFAPVYYLSLLPRFGSEDEADRAFMRNAEKYPRFLEILVSNIAVPIVAVYTLVLFLYFVKILVTLNWPSGQLGPMVLWYSAAGLILFVLASPLDNRFALFYRRAFPKALIPVVVMQLVSVGIRLRAYGFTESRYYVALFGIFSILTGVLMTIKPSHKNSLIALLAASFAVFSVIPPVDAFTVSRISQIARVENILRSEGILTDVGLQPKSGASERTKFETTSILSYLDRHGSLNRLSWLPEDFSLYDDMEGALGFPPEYASGESGGRFLYVSVDAEKPVAISGYDVSVNIYTDRYANGPDLSTFSFSVRGVDYTLSVDRLSREDARVSVKNAAGEALVESTLHEFADSLRETAGAEKGTLPPERMTLEAAKDGYRLKIVFQNISMTVGEGTDAGVDYSAVVLFGAP